MNGLHPGLAAPGNERSLRKATIVRWAVAEATAWAWEFRESKGWSRGRVLVASWAVAQEWAREEARGTEDELRINNGSHSLCSAFGIYHPIWLHCWCGYLTMRTSTNKKAAHTHTRAGKYSICHCCNQLYCPLLLLLLFTRCCLPLGHLKNKL